MVEAFIGVDVGTGSARAGVFDAGGTLIASAKRPIAIWHEPGGVVEHSSADIWSAVCQSAREAAAASRLPLGAFKGIGFDATCSLVVLDAAGAPLSVGPSGEPKRDTIVWMDHRAAGEADAINAGGHDVLRYVGGAISPEMQTPKLAWLAKHKPRTFAEAAHFFDLTDFLTWRASGAEERSVCTATCKFTYLAHEKRWSADYFESIGLGALAQDGFRRIGAEVVEPGTALGEGLSAAAAAEMGLPVGLPVGAGFIDAHAGAAGTLGASFAGVPGDPRRRLALILGTSACCMAVSDEPRFIDGLWGPYFSALTPNQWLTEGGQSAFGAAIDHMMRMHPAYAAFAAKAGPAAFETIERDCLARAGSLSGAARLGAELTIVPDFLGNRSPFADPKMRGAMVGLDLREDYESLCEFYVAGLTGLAHGVAQIIRSLEKGGYDFETLVVSGGAARSPLVRQIIADACGKPVASPATSEPVLLGAAMLGAVAAGRRTLPEAMAAMSSLASEIQPARGEIAAFHRSKRRAFEILQKAERQLRAAPRAPAQWPALVIFDCDGVLVDSENIALLEVRRGAAELGVRLSAAQAIDRFLGFSFDESMQRIEIESGARVPEGFRSRVAARILARLELEVAAVAGVREAIGALSAKVCVASSSGPERIERSLKKAGLYDRLAPNIFSTSMVSRGKPHPDVFLHAARAMGVSPQDCLVIEDSLPGVTAAAAAGMAVFGFAGGSHFKAAKQSPRLKAAGASLTFRDMRRLPDLAAAAARARPRVREGA